jgi:hypothetical protein
MMMKKEIEMKKVTFLNAKDGKIQVTYTTETGENTVEAANSMDVTLLANYLDFSDTMCSSSMDFADEYGFPFQSAAWDMLHRGLEAA